ncbi:exodeoxyribonuclease VII large subunit [Rhizorhapis sp. SPR117]|uniref:exodeoxyribonuclease VII large subunit n=1 Tax=Rhizorhapis sp. SPR117 TaxID=2912611 RepID=UPI001F01C993|nr:exodeoxyribonuclease VII large subunit [Rhizorhapis sp. SPR117]
MPDTPSQFDPSGRLLAEDVAGDNAPALSITEISALLKRTVEERFGYVKLRGEISGYKRAASGHVYLALKDEGAVIDGVMWKGSAARLPFAPEDGIEVVVSGKITTYPGRSKYQIVIERMELAGEGALMQLLERLKQKLTAEGLFDPARKKPLPYLPRVIGVVTSPTGAVIRDILHRLADRCPTHVVLWPVMVQGEGAALQVARAIRGFDAMEAGGAIPRPDLLIVARGGGSIEDLWAFNEEAVIRAVADCRIPVISAVGHETDTTLCDYAADVRAPTPTAAAEIAVPVRAELTACLSELGLRAGRAVHRYHERARERLTAQMRLMPTLEALLQPQRQRTDDLADRLRRALSHRLSDAGKELSEASGALRPALLKQHVMRERARLEAVRLRPDVLRRRLADSRMAFDRLSRLAISLDPDRPLSRGFARVMQGDQVISTATAARAAGHVTLKFQDDEVGAVISGSLEKLKKTATSKPSKTRSPSSDEDDPPVRQQDLFS